MSCQAFLGEFMHTRIFKFRLPALLLAIVGGLLLASCKQDPEMGKITLRLADAPIDNAQKVIVQVSGVVLQPEHGADETVTFAQPKAIDLLGTASTGPVALLDHEEVPAFVYKSVILKVDAASNTLDSYVELADGSTYSLKLPDSYNGEISTGGIMTVPINRNASFTIELDLRRAIRSPASSTDPDYGLRPAVRLLDDDKLGTVNGSIDPSLVTSGCTPAVYFYQADGLSTSDAGDINSEGTKAQPYSELIPQPDSATGGYRFSNPLLPEGTYTALFTCDAALDDPEQTDTLNFSAAKSFELRRDASVAITLP